MSYKILEIDPYLKSFENDINLRMENYEKKKKELLQVAYRNLQMDTNILDSTEQNLAGFTESGHQLQKQCTSQVISMTGILQHVL